MDLRQQLAFTIEAMSQYYGRKIEKAVLSMMVDDLEDLPVESVMAAFKAYRRDPKNRSMPLPAQIRDIVSPTKTNESKSRDDAARIQQAIVKYGYSNPTEAEQFIGSKAWAVVQSFGGWNYICSNHGLGLNPGTFYAQARERLGDIHKQDFEYNDKQLTSHQENELIDSQEFNK